MKMSHFIAVAALLLGAACLALAQSNGSIDGSSTGHSKSSVIQTAGDQSHGLPEGKGKAALLRACVQCHEIELVTGERHTKTGWRRLVEMMVGYGAELSDPETVDVTAYLAKYFGQVNVNTAAAAQLEEVLGLTEKEAQSIVSYRKQNGDIKSLDQLKSVPGVSPDEIQAKAEVIAFRD